MEQVRIAVFGTTSIQAGYPRYDGQRPTFESVGRRGVLTRAYSLGKLEAAHRQGFDIYVVTMLPQVDEACHAWWRSLVPASRVFTTDGLLRTFSSDELPAILLEPWKRLYQSLRRPWPEGVTTPEAALDCLEAAYGVVSGVNIAGYETS